MRLHAACLGLAMCAALAVAPCAASEPFYKGKRLSVLINYGAGGPADIEGRLFARHIGRHIDGTRTSSCRISMAPAG